MSTLDAELERELREDSISIHSSVSQKNHGHTHGGGHAHHAHFHGHSGHATPKHIRGATSGQHTPLHSYSGQHTPHHVPNLGYRHSFASMAVSLPPGLEYQPSKEIYTPTNSSFTSREDLQCTWHDLPRFDIGPVSTTAEPPLQPEAEPFDHRQREPVSNNLSSLFMHQVEQKLNQYKNILMKSRSKTKLSNVASFLSVGSAAQGAAHRDPGPSVSRQASTSRKYRQNSGPEKPGIRRNSSNISKFIFSFEDMTTDSTSVLKDFRHPSLSSVNLATSKPGQPLGRVVSLHRNPSSISTKIAPPRPRYMSEGHDNSKDNLHGSKLFICTPKDTTANKSGSSLCVSMDFEFQGILAPTPITLDNTGDNAIQVR